MGSDKASGYNIGTGPRALARVLRLLDDNGVTIEEYKVARRLLNRLDTACLTNADLAWLETVTPVHPLKTWQYRKLDEEAQAHRSLAALRSLPVVIPYAIIDPRILDLAIRFFEDPGAKLMKGYVRLEEIVRKRTGLTEHGSKLFGDALNGDKAILSWTDLDANERAGRASLFTGAFRAYRNPRAHREVQGDEHSYLSELLLLNHLYVLEAQARESVPVGR